MMLTSIQSEEDTLTDQDEIKNIITFNKKQFELIRNEFQDQYLSVSQFVFLMKEIKKADVTALVQLYQLIDTLQKNQINFEQFSNFLVEMHDQLNKEQSLYQIKLKLRDSLIRNPIDKLYEINGQFAYLEQNKKKLFILDDKFNEMQIIQIGTISILQLLYVSTYGTLILSSNDKFLNFYDLKTEKLQRRFMVPELQTHLQYSQENEIMYSATDNGTIYSWDMEKIFSKEFSEFLISGPKLQDCFKLVIVDQPLSIIEYASVKEIGLTCMLCIDVLEILAVGSTDTLIRLYESKIKTSEKFHKFSAKKILSGDHKILQGHTKPIKQFTYCPEYKYLISCSYDYDVVVWNIYLEHPVAKLQGHEASLVTVLSISKRIPIIISCDIKGIIKLWDPRTFQSIQHIKIDESNKAVLKAIVHLKQKDIVIVGCRNLLIYDFEQSFDPNVTDDFPIQGICYSNLYLELHVATRKTIKTWCLKTGLVKRLSATININQDILVFSLDYTQRRGFVGTHQGNIFCFDLFTGQQTSFKQGFLKEISGIHYSQLYQTLIITSWDKQIRIYHDQDNKEIILRNIKNAHPSEIFCSAFSEHLMLIATTSKQHEIRLWDFEKGTPYSRLNSSGEIIYMKFLDPYPLLACSDHQGQIVIYIVMEQMMPLSQQKSCAVIWKNMFTIMKTAPVHSIEFLHRNDESLIIGDENGDIRVLSIQQVIKGCNVKALRHQDISFNRNPHRFFQLNYQEYDYIMEPLQPLLSERTAYQTNIWKAHKTQIKSIVLCSEIQAIISLSQDLQVKLWNLEGKLITILKQGQSIPQNIKIIPNYKTKTQQLVQQVEEEMPKLQMQVPQPKQSIHRQFRSVTQHEPNKTKLGFEMKEQFQKLEQIDSLSIFQTLKELEKIEEKKEQRKKREQDLLQLRPNKFQKKR